MSSSHDLYIVGGRPGVAGFLLMLLAKRSCGQLHNSVHDSTIRRALKSFPVMVLLDQRVCPNTQLLVSTSVG